MILNKENWKINTIKVFDLIVFKIMIQFNLNTKIGEIKFKEKLV